MKAPQWARVGECWRFQWADCGIAMSLERPSQNGYGITAEITVEALPNGVPGGHIHWSRLRLSDTDDRDKLARYLTKRTGDDRNTSTVDWQTLLQQACTITARDWRKGEPVVNLATVEPPAQRPFLLERLLPANETSLIYADGGSGKSLLGLSIALAYQAGVALPCGIKPTEKGEVLYLDWETNAVTHARRLRALCRGFGIALPPIHYLRMSQPLVMSQARVLAEVDRLKVGLVIVDSIGFAAAGDINDANTATEMYNTLRAWNLTALGLHHINKAAAEKTDGTSKPTGAAYFWNGARMAWELRASATETQLRLSLWHRKDNDGGRLSQPLGLQFDFDNGAQTTRLRQFNIEDDAELAAFGGAAFVIRNAMRLGAKTVNELHEDTAVDKETIKRTLARTTWFVKLVSGHPGRGGDAVWGLAE